MKKKCAGHSAFFHLGLLICLALFCTTGMPAYATTITVTNTNDSGPGSLRQALADVQNGDTIVFKLGGAATISLTSGELVINKDIAVNGPGANLLTIARAQGAPSFRIFNVVPVHTVTIQGQTITNGHTNASPVSGGGIYNDHSNVTVNKCVLTDNSARSRGGFNGGGIGNHGGFSGSASLTINDSIISDNNVKDGITANVGGGIYNYGVHGSATVTINNSTISGNQAFQGGGLFSDGGVTGSTAVVTISNSTISGNSADQLAGAIVNQGNEGGQATVTVTNSTFAGNSSCNCNFWAGAIFNSGNQPPKGAILEMGNTIFKGGLTTQRNIYNQGGVVISDGYNLTNDAGVLNTNVGVGGFNAPGDQINTDTLLGPLQDNGGSKLTRALLPGSPAIDAGDPYFTPPPFFDQRGPGFDRVVNGRIDKGSFEVQAGTTPTPTPTCVPGGTPGPWTQASVYPLSVSGAAVASNGTSIYAFGGNTNGSAHAEAYRYNPSANTWTPLASMPTGGAYLCHAQ